MRKSSDKPEQEYRGRLKSSFWTLLENDDYVRKMVRIFIKRQPLSQNKLSKKIGISPVNLSRYLNKAQYKSLSDLDIIKLCRYFGFDVEVKLKVREDQ